jgi:GxxExxY protein
MNRIHELIEDVYTQLGAGRREKAYQVALAYALNNIGITASVEVSNPVYYYDVHVATGFIDILTATHVLEIKYVRKLTDIHRQQCQAYMRDRERDGILINFGASPPEVQELSYANN